MEADKLCPTIGTTFLYLMFVYRQSDQHHKIGFEEIQFVQCNWLLKLLCSYGTKLLYPLFHAEEKRMHIGKTKCLHLLFNIRRRCHNVYAVVQFIPDVLMRWNPNFQSMGV